VKSIRKVYAGEIWLDSHTTAAVMHQFAAQAADVPAAEGRGREHGPLSRRELEIVSKGSSIFLLNPKSRRSSRRTRTAACSRSDNGNDC
jgi:hypothetical protein